MPEFDKSKYKQVLLNTYGILVKDVRTVPVHGRNCKVRVKDMETLRLEFEAERALGRIQHKLEMAAINAETMYKQANADKSCWVFAWFLRDRDHLNVEMLLREIGRGCSASGALSVRTALLKIEDECETQCFRKIDIGVEGGHIYFATLLDRDRVLFARAHGKEFRASRGAVAEIEAKTWSETDFVEPITAYSYSG